MRTTTVMSTLVSESSKGRAEVYKYFIEQRYEKLFSEIHQRAERRQLLEQNLKNRKIEGEKKEAYIQRLQQKENEYMRLRRTRLSVHTFDKICLLGKGAYGEVGLVRMKITGKYYAMKMLKKKDMIHKHQVNTKIKSDQKYLINTNFNRLVM